LIKLPSQIIVITITICFTLTGCGMFTPAPKPDIGPAGKPVESKPNPPIMERFLAPPPEMYDLEALAGAIFEGIKKEDWLEADGNFTQMRSSWLQIKSSAGDKKGIKEGDKAIEKLAASITARKRKESYEHLNELMGSVSDVGKSYKLSPIADIIGLGSSIRNVSFYVEDKEWTKAASKMKELEGTWQHVKPALEQVGILGESTKTHSRINQLKGAVIAESKGPAEEHIAYLNESVAIIRQYYRGK